MKQFEFLEIVKEQLEKQFKEEADKMEQTAQLCAKSIMKKRVVHVFGCGHSQMFAMEVFYRAGGLVPINALLIPHLALFPKAKLSTLQERVEGFSNEYLDLENTASDDTMIIVSISGRNAGVVDMALAAKAKGMNVIAMTSVQFSSSVQSRHSSQKNLSEVADIVLDIKCVEGDACLTMDGFDKKFTGTSTILGMTVLDAIMARTIEVCVESGYQPPVYVSSNLDIGDEINKTYIKQYQSLIGCL